MAWTIAQKTGRPLHSDLTAAYDWPNTITLAVALRLRYDSYLELPEVPPEEIWDYPRLMRQWINRLYPQSSGGEVNGSYAEINTSDIED